MGSRGTAWDGTTKKSNLADDVTSARERAVESIGICARQSNYTTVDDDAVTLLQASYFFARYGSLY
jgi:hypothetical protein